MSPATHVTRLTPPWHALPLEDVLARLHASPHGLTDAEARARLERDGPNAPRVPPPASALHIVLRQFASVVVLLLVAAAAIALLQHDRIDAAVIGAVLLLDVALGAAVELRARRAMESLERLQVPAATALRDGAPRRIDARALVPGDVIILGPGEGIAADARLLEALELSTMEAPLTGESVPVEKHATTVLGADTPLPERIDMLYQGTTVVAGHAHAVVVATGDRTEVGRIGVLVGTLGVQRTPLERRLDVLGRRLAIAAIAVALLIGALALAAGTPLGVVVETALAVAIAAVPEGLPAVVTITLALGMRRMARRNALVRRLPAVESLGSATHICTDKTGTLTIGTPMVAELWIDGRTIDIAAARELLAEPRHPVARALRLGILTNRALVHREGDRWRIEGDPTEGALRIAAEEAGLHAERVLAEWPREHELPFTSERMFMATTHRAPDGGRVTLAKGAPERLIPRCRRLATGRGEVPLDEGARGAVERANEAMAARGLRVLALASGDDRAAEGEPLPDLTLLALVGMIDPPAPGVPDTIRMLRSAGIRTVMITGDQRLTALAIARQLAMLEPGDDAMDGGTLDALSDAELAARVPSTAVYSRVSPEAKLRIVRALQAREAIVAMLGDGVNDAAALRCADVGIAMGRGTDVAKDAAGAVLVDDRFETVAAAVEEGRVIFENIRKFVFYLFSCNLAEIFVLLGAGVLRLPLPLLPLQILWINLVTDSAPALALAVEPAEPDVMRRPPRDPRAALLSGAMLRSTLVYAALIAGVSLAGFVIGLRSDARAAMTMAFMTLTLAQLAHLGNARQHGAVITRERALANPWAVRAVILAVALQLALVVIPTAGRVMGVVPLSAAQWTAVGVLSVLPGVVGQLWKRWRQAS